MLWLKAQNYALGLCAFWVDILAADSAQGAYFIKLWVPIYKP